jgi:hypothetical protein
MRHAAVEPACVKLFSFVTAMKQRNYIASVSAPRALRTIPAYSARANQRLRTSDDGILQSTKAAGRYDDIRKPWRLGTGAGYPDSTLARQV